MSISLRLSDAEATLIKNYAAMNRMSVSDLVRQTVLGRIEDEIDLTAYEKAMAEHKENPVTFTLDEVEKELGLL